MRAKLFASLPLLVEIHVLTHVVHVGHDVLFRGAAPRERQGMPPRRGHVVTGSLREDQKVRIRFVRLTTADCSSQILDLTLPGWASGQLVP